MFYNMISDMLTLYLNILVKFLFLFDIIFMVHFISTHSTKYCLVFSIRNLWSIKQFYLSGLDPGFINLQHDELI